MDCNSIQLNTNKSLKMFIKTKHKFGVCLIFLGYKSLKVFNYNTSIGEREAKIKFIARFYGKLFKK